MLWTPPLITLRIEHMFLYVNIYIYVYIYIYIYIRLDLYDPGPEPTEDHGRWGL